MYHKKEIIKTSLLLFVEYFRLLRGVELPDDMAVWNGAVEE